MLPDYPKEDRNALVADIFFIYIYQITMVADKLGAVLRSKDIGGLLVLK